MAKIVGQQSELETLRQFVATVPDGPRVLSLEGEAGIGKTTLVNEGISLAKQESYRVLACSRVEPEARLSYTSVTDLLEGSADGWGELPDPQRLALETALLMREPADVAADQRAVAMAVLGVLRSLSTSQPVLLTVDDEQWLDPPSAGVLSFCARRLGDEPIGILVASRLQAEPADPMGLERSMPESRYGRIRMEPLTLDALGMLLTDRIGLRATTPVLRRVHEVSGGNPFFALELGRVVQQSDSLLPGKAFSAPENLRDLIRARLAGLPPPDTVVLVTAAAMAHPSVSVLEDAAPRSGRVQGALARAARAGVIEVVAEDIRFVHPLYASAIYAESAPRLRQDVHRRLADAVADPEERARHFALAASEPDAHVAAALDKAARLAADRGAPAAAAELGEMAIRFTPPVDTDERRRRQLGAADNHFLAGDQRAAASLLESVVGSSPRGEIRAEALIRLGWVRLEEDLDAAETLLTEALEEDGAPVGVRSEALEHLAVVSLNRGKLEDAERCADAALVLAEQDGDPQLIRDALTTRAIPRAYLGHGVDRKGLARASRLSETTGRFLVYWNPKAALAELLVVTDQLDEAREILLELADTASERGDEPSASYLSGYLARLELRAGRWDLAIEHEREMQLWGDEGAISALIDAHRGKFEETRSRATETLTASEGSGHILIVLESLEALGAAEMLSGDHEASRRHLSRAWELARDTGVREPNKVPFLPDYIEALIRSGDRKKAELLIEWLQDAGRSPERPRALATAARCRGLLLAANGTLDGALASLECALQEHARLPDPFQLSRTLLVLGMVRRRAKQKRAARQALERAGEIFGRLGAAPWAEKVGSELSALGGRPPATGGLTPTELRVTQLAAAGLTNRQIAASLFLSTRTVEGHLSHAYHKLGVRSRSQLAPRFEGAGDPS